MPCINPNSNIWGGCRSIFVILMVISVAAMLATTVIICAGDVINDSTNNTSSSPYANIEKLANDETKLNAMVTGGVSFLSGVGAFIPLYNKANSIGLVSKVGLVSLLLLAYIAVLVFVPCTKDLFTLGKMAMPAMYLIGVLILCCCGKHDAWWSLGRCSYSDVEGMVAEVEEFATEKCGKLANNDRYDRIAQYQHLITDKIKKIRQSGGTEGIKKLNECTKLLEERGKYEEIRMRRKDLIRFNVKSPVMLKDDSTIRGVLRKKKDYDSTEGEYIWEIETTEGEKQTMHLLEKNIKHDTTRWDDEDLSALRECNRGIDDFESKVNDIRKRRKPDEEEDPEAPPAAISEQAVSDKPEENKPVAAVRRRTNSAKRSGVELQPMRISSGSANADSGGGANSRERRRRRLVVMERLLQEIAEAQAKSSQ